MMEQFKVQLKLDAEGENFNKESTTFFDAIANEAFTGKVKSEFSKYETFKPYTLGWHPNFDSPSMFSKLLQGIQKQKPDLLANAVAKGVHDSLNTFPGGLPVENEVGDKWNLSGDGTLNAATIAIARKAVAQSQMNVISTYNLVGPLDFSIYFKKVWDFTPKASVNGAKQLIEVVKRGTDIKSEELQKAIVNLIKENYLLMIEKLVAEKAIRKA
jgi:hypothetical protein